MSEIGGIKMKLALLYSGGHVHHIETSEVTLLSSLIDAMRSGEKVHVVWNDTNERMVALINLDRLEMAWEVQ